MSEAAEGAYVEAVLRFYMELPETPRRSFSLDRVAARGLYRRGVPLPIVESAFLLATLRRMARPEELPKLQKIRSLAYFLPVIEELQQQTVPEGYLPYLRAKLRRILPAPV